MLSPINSVKHYVQRAITTVGAAAIINEILVDAVVASAVNLPTEVLEGSVVKAVFVEVSILGTGAAESVSAFNITLEKRIGGQPAMTNAQSLNLFTYPNKKNILYSTQGMIHSQISGESSRFVIKQWFAIPKGKQRFGLGDQLILNFSNITAVNHAVCGIYVYKEYR